MSAPGRIESIHPPPFPRRQDPEQRAEHEADDDSDAAKQKGPAERTGDDPDDRGGKVADRHPQIAADQMAEVARVLRPERTVPETEDATQGLHRFWSQPATESGQQHLGRVTRDQAGQQKGERQGREGGHQVKPEPPQEEDHRGTSRVSTSMACGPSR